MDAQFTLFAQDGDAAVAQAFGATRDLRKVYEESLEIGLERTDAALLAGASDEQTVSTPTTAVDELSRMAADLRSTPGRFTY